MQVDMLALFKQFNVQMGWIALGFVVGIIVGYLFAKILRLRAERAVRRFRGELLGFVYDVSKDMVDIVGLNPMGEGTYFSTDPLTPLIVLKPARVKPKLFKFLGKPIVFVIAFGMYGFAADTSDVGKVGIASLSMEGSDIKIGKDTPVSIAIENLITNLLTKQGQLTGEIHVNPEMKIGLAYEVPEFISALTSITTSIAAGTMQGLKDTVIGAEHYTKIIEKYSRAKEAAYGFWIKLLIVGGAIALIFWLISMVLGGGFK